MYHGCEGGAFNEQDASRFQIMKIDFYLFYIFSGNSFNKAIVMKMLLKKSERHVLQRQRERTAGTSI